MSMFAEVKLLPLFIFMFYIACRKTAGFHGVGLLRVSSCRVFLPTDESDIGEPLGEAEVKAWEKNNEVGTYVDPLNLP